MHPTRLRISLVTALLVAACDGIDPADAPDRGALDDAITFRPVGSGTLGGGSTRLNTGMLFPEGMPVRHFARNGSAVTYDDSAATTVTFQAVRLVNGGGGLTTYSAATNTIDSQYGLLKINGVPREAGALLGSEWLFKVSDSTRPARNLTLRVTGVAIADVPGAAEVPLYNFSLDGASAHYGPGPYSMCDALDPLTLSTLALASPEQTPPGVPNIFKPEFTAVLYGGVVVSSLGAVSSHDSMITLACTSGAVGKSALWGYPSWVSSYAGLSGVQQLQATTRAIRADYCADGTSHTQDGTPLQVRDRFTAEFDDPIEATEAVWGGNGSRCKVTDNRLDTAEVFACSAPVAANDCTQLASDWITGPDSFMWTKVDPELTPLAPQRACDVAGATPGCADPGIEATVCAGDAYCCTTAWDAICVGEVTSLGADDEACCADNGGPGCGDVAVADCVGEYDPYCTDSRWDSFCALEVEHLGCGLCH